jgi:hypothetical protein
MEAAIKISHVYNFYVKIIMIIAQFIFSNNEWILMNSLTWFNISVILNL